MRRIFLVAVLAVALIAACSGDSEVGSEQLLNVQDEARRLGERTTTIAPAVTSTTAAIALGRPTTTRPPTTTTVASAPRELVITIYADREGPTQFDPNNASVFVNFPVRWVNRDRVNRSVVFDDGSKRSPLIPPGGSWATTFPTPGRYGYQDGTRPYAVGAVTVVAR